MARRLRCEKSCREKLRRADFLYCKMPMEHPMTTPVPTHALTFSIPSRIVPAAAATAVDQAVRTCRSAGAGSRSFRSRAIAACFAFGVGFAPLGVHAADYTPLYKAPPMAPVPDQNAGQDFIASWLAMVTATQAAQPNWLAPLATVTPLLVQQYRFDLDFQNQGNGSHIDNYGGGRGLENHSRL
jgi:hypothetical protein